jgi:ATP-dependent Clp protease ATP-binding subunit ClpX
MFTKNDSSFGLDGLDSNIAEILFVDPNISAEDALRVATRILSAEVPDVLKITTALYNNLNASIKEFGDISNRNLEEKEILHTQIHEKLEAWTRLIRKPKMAELLKLNEYFRLPISDFSDLSITSPVILHDILNLYIIDQKDFTSKLAMAYYIHMLKHDGDGSRNIELPKTTLLVSGPTGVGKSLSMQVLARLFDRPTATVNCNALVSEGIIGPSVSDAFTEIYIKSNRKRSKVEQACIHFDEFDKLFVSDSGVYNKRIVNELLNIIDDSGEATFREDFGRNPENIRISTRNMMFVFSGVFENLPEIIAKRMHPGMNKIGFSLEQRPIAPGNDLYKHATNADYLEAGVKPEIMGRITSLTFVEELSVESIVKILLSNINSPLKPYQKFFQLHGIHLDISLDGAELIAQHVVKNRLGARGIKSVLNTLLYNYMFHLSVPEGNLNLDASFINNNLN